MTKLIFGLLSALCCQSLAYSIPLDLSASDLKSQDLTIESYTSCSKMDRVWDHGGFFRPGGSSTSMERVSCGGQAGKGKVYRSDGYYINYETWPDMHVISLPSDSFQETDARIELEYSLKNKGEIIFSSSQVSPLIRIYKIVGGKINVKIDNKDFPKTAWSTEPNSSLRIKLSVNSYKTTLKGKYEKPTYGDRASESWWNIEAPVDSQGTVVIPDTYVAVEFLGKHDPMNPSIKVEGELITGTNHGSEHVLKKARQTIVLKRNQINSLGVLNLESENP